jgi:hypothetical protein
MGLSSYIFGFSIILLAIEEIFYINIDPEDIAINRFDLCVAFIMELKLTV